MYIIYCLENVAQKKKGVAPKETPTERKCRYCKQVKSIDEFYPSKNTSGGHSYVCKECNTVVVHESSLKRRFKRLGREGFVEEIERLKHEIALRRKILKHTETK